MGMLLRRRFDNAEPVKTTESQNKEPKKAEEPKAAKETVKDEKPKTVRRGRPTK